MAAARMVRELQAALEPVPEAMGLEPEEEALVLEERSL